MDTLYKLLDAALPFQWAQYMFMKNAFLAVLLAAPLFGALGSMVVANRMAFFSDALGHGAFTGVALGSLFGVSVKPALAAALFSICFAALITVVKKRAKASGDTVIGVFSSLAAAFGLAILARNGSLSRYTNVLVGEILSVAPQELAALAVLFAIIAVCWFFLANQAFFVVLDSALAKSKGMNAFVIELLFTAMLAALVSVSIAWIGLLLVNSFLVLPAAAARLLSGNLRRYHALSAAIALVCGIMGLIAAYYANIGAAAAIVLLCGCCYFLALAFRGIFSKIKLYVK